MRDDDGLMQKMAIEMENTDRLKRHSGCRINNTCLVEYADEGKGKEKDCVQVSSLSTEGTNIEELIWKKRYCILFGYVVGCVCGTSK